MFAWRELLVKSLMLMLILIASNGPFILVICRADKRFVDELDGKFTTQHTVHSTLAMIIPRK